MATNLLIKGNTATIVINEEITMENSAEICDFIYGLSFDIYNDVTDILVSISSLGGNVMAGFNIVNALVTSEKFVTTRNEFMAASIASLIFMVGQKREAMAHSFMMIHNPYNPNGGSEDEVLKMIKDSLMIVLGDQFENLSELMDNETWFNVDELIELGIIDTKIDIEKGEMKNTKINNKMMELYEVANKLISEKNEEKMKDTKEEIEAVEETVDAVKETVEETIEVKEEDLPEFTDEAETEEVIAEEVEEEIVAEAEVAEEVIEEPVAELELVENKAVSIDEIANFKDIISGLKTEVDELKNSLTIYKEKDEREAKLEVLNKAGVAEDSFDKWLKFDIETIKDLAGTTVNKKSEPLSDSINTNKVGSSAEQRLREQRILNKK
jgi:ATP-dependent protease ClpP protease subunit